MGVRAMPVAEMRELFLPPEKGLPLSRGAAPIAEQLTNSPRAVDRREVATRVEIPRVGGDLTQ